MSVFLPLLQAFLTSPQQQLKDEFFSGLEAGKSKKDDAEAKAGDGKEDRMADEPTLKPKAKPKLQLKKKANDDPFASDEEEGDPEPKTPDIPSKAVSKPPSKASGKPPSKVGGGAKKPPSKNSTVTKRIKESESEEEEVKPKRRAPLKSKK